jgi:hypothetical protein
VEDQAAEQPSLPNGFLESAISLLHGHVEEAYRDPHAADADVRPALELAQQLHLALPATQIEKRPRREMFVCTPLVAAVQSYAFAFAYAHNIQVIGE